MRMSINPAGAIPAFNLSDRLRKARQLTGLTTRASVTRLEAWRERSAA